MVRLPRYWHPQAARRASSTLAWAPGWQGTGQQPIRPLAIQSYTRKISQVPLTGGQAQGVIPGFATNSGSATSPTAFTQLAAVTITAAGTYSIAWSVSLSGTLSGTDANNFQIYQNGLLLATSVNTATAATFTQTPVSVTAVHGDVIQVFNVAGGTSGSVYGAVISGQSGPLMLQAGPQGLGTVWYPVSIVISTTTGALDTSTALIYLGPSATPATLQGTVYSGNGTVSLAIPAMSPGQTIIVTWTNGHAGDTAAFNITGTMDALTTG